MQTFYVIHTGSLNNKYLSDFLENYKLQRQFKKIGF